MLHGKAIFLCIYVLTVCQILREEQKMGRGIRLEGFHIFVFIFKKYETAVKDVETQPK